MNAQGHQEATGQAKITKGYNLPATYVIHTVGPIVEDIPTDKDIQLLASCYSSSLQIAQERQLATIAFCCISTGVFHFPQQQAADDHQDLLRRRPVSLEKLFDAFPDCSHSRTSLLIFILTTIFYFLIIFYFPGKRKGKCD